MPTIDSEGRLAYHAYVMRNHRFRILLLLVVSVLVLWVALRPPAADRRPPAASRPDRRAVVQRATRPPLDPVVIGLERLSRREALGVRGAVPIRLEDGKTGAKIGGFVAGAGVEVKADPVMAQVIVRAPRFERRREAVRIVPVGGDGVRAGPSKYAGTLVFRVRNERLEVTNEIDVESYLAGVVPGEVPDSFAAEAQKALAVAARTYTISSLGKHAAEGFDLCDGTHCQMYIGVLPWAPQAKRAVQQTRGLLVWHGETPVRTFYSADCGGRTTNNEDVRIADVPLDPLPYLRGIADRPGPRGPDFCAASRHHQWTRALSHAQLEARLNRRAATRIGRLTGVRFVAYDTSGRVKTVRLQGIGLPPGVSRASFIGPPPPVVREVDGWTFRRSVGWRVLKSTMVRVRHPAPDRYEFCGRGYGHGIGLCQIGANGMASAPYGCGFRRILAHYYPGAEVGPLSRGERVARLPASSRLLTDPSP
jgi:stage II sporulation protein D